MNLDPLPKINTIFKVTIAKIDNANTHLIHF